MRAGILVVLGLATASWAQAPVGQIYAADAKVKGAVELASGGARVMSGSYVSAGESTAVLKLERGGEVRVCPKTSVSVATSPSGRDLMLGLSSGGLETHYTVSATADTIVTPDFRILLAGPGRFDFAIEAGKSGDTCIRALPGNSSSLIVSELIGDGTYQVKPAERLVFLAGKLANPDHEHATCGCPSSAPIMTAQVTPPEAAPAASPAPPKPAVAEPKPEAPVHVEVDAPFVFRAEEIAPSPLEGAITLHVARNVPQIDPLPPPPAEVNHPAAQPARVEARKPKQPKRFFGRIKAFFASIFH